jgi:hypothetical protein
MGSWRVRDVVVVKISNLEVVKSATTKSALCLPGLACQRCLSRQRSDFCLWNDIAC